MKGKLRKILGLAVSAAMAVTAVVPWTGMTAFAADGDRWDWSKLSLILPV